MKYSKYILVLIFISIGAVEAWTQCPMCRMAAESNLENGGTAGTGLNTGILYMLTMPYVIVALIAFIWIKNRKSDVDFLEEQLQLDESK